MQGAGLTAVAPAPSRAGCFWFQADCGPRRRGKQQLRGLQAAVVVEEGRIPRRVLRRSQELNQNPFFEQAPGTRGQKHKLDPGLPHGIGPGHAPGGLDARARIGQIEAHKNLLVYVERGHGLNGQTRCHPDCG